MDYPETWAVIPGYEGLYEVSDYGRVRRIMHSVLTPERQRRNYLRVALYNHRHKPRRWMVHQLVARVFLGPCPEGKVINHLDGNPENNRPENLEYATQQDNILHSYRVLKRPPHHQGETTHFAKLSEADVLNIRQMRDEGSTYKEIAELFNTKQANVWFICQGKTWKHLL